MLDTGKVPRAQRYATLRISKTGVRSADISARLGLVPTFAHEAGDKGRSGHVRREAIWGLSTEHLGRGDLEEHLTTLLDQVSPCSRELLAMQREGFVMDWFCFVDVDGMGGVGLGAEPISRLEPFHISLDLDIYGMEHDDHG